MPGLIRLGDGGLGIFQYRPTVAKPPETRALAKLTLTESRNLGSMHDSTGCRCGSAGVSRILCRGVSTPVTVIYLRDYYPET